MLPLLERACPAGWALIPALHLPRLQRRIEAVMVAPGAVLVFAPDRATATAAAIDLADFHDACHDAPVIPVALVQRERVAAQTPFPFAGAAPVVACSPLWLPSLLTVVGRFPAVPGLSGESFMAGAYRPVPALLRAACDLYARHGEARLTLTHSGRNDLARTRAAVTAAVTSAQAEGRRVAVFVTGAPGAGKTLCGLDLAFDPAAPAAFLTGNPALLHVLRAALVRDAAGRGMGARAARQRIEAVVQPLHGFRDHHVPGQAPPPERVVVLDEAQRCWTGIFARSKTRNRAVKLTDSEPGHLLDIMARHNGWCAVVCLLGGGQEIHTGEGGLAEWGAALRARPDWSVVAAVDDAGITDPRRLMGPLPRLHADPALHLGAAVRAFRAPRLTRWVDEMLGNDPAAARGSAGADLPVRLVRDLRTMQEMLRTAGSGRAGLVATAGSRRLRAEGLGGLLWHQDEDAVARWYLDEWPDIRSSAALEVAATEFGAQGLELDRVGLCWDLDLCRGVDGTWAAQAFRGAAWTRPRAAEALANRLNAYRVLLTRARQEVIIWVPRGDSRDATRDPARYDAIATFLSECGVRDADCGTDEMQRHGAADDVVQGLAV